MHVLHLAQDFMLGNKLFIVCEYIPHSLLQLLEGTAESLDSAWQTSVTGETAVPLLLNCDHYILRLYYLYCSCSCCCGVTV